MPTLIRRQAWLHERICMWRPASRQKTQRLTPMAARFRKRLRAEYWRCRYLDDWTGKLKLYICGPSRW